MPEFDAYVVVSGTFDPVLRVPLAYSVTFLGSTGELLFRRDAYVSLRSGGDSVTEGTWDLLPATPGEYYRNAMVLPRIPARLAEFIRLFRAETAGQRVALASWNSSMELLQRMGRLMKEPAMVHGLVPAPSSGELAPLRAALASLDEEFPLVDYVAERLGITGIDEREHLDAVTALRCFRVDPKGFGGHPEPPESTLLRLLLQDLGEDDMLLRHLRSRRSAERRAEAVLLATDFSAEDAATASGMLAGYRSFALGALEDNPGGLPRCLPHAKQRLREYAKGLGETDHVRWYRNALRDRRLVVNEVSLMNYYEGPLGTEYVTVRDPDTHRRHVRLRAYSPKTNLHLVVDFPSMQLITVIGSEKSTRDGASTDKMHEIQDGFNLAAHVRASGWGRQVLDVPAADDQATEERGTA